MVRAPVRQPPPRSSSYGASSVSPPAASTNTASLVRHKRPAPASRTGPHSPLTRVTGTSMSLSGIQELETIFTAQLGITDRRALAGARFVTLHEHVQPVRREEIPRQS